MLKEMKSQCSLSLEHNPQVGFSWQWEGEVKEELKNTGAYLQIVFCLGCHYPELSPCMCVSVLSWHAWHDRASAYDLRPTESDSELSVSSFLSVASHSYDEDEGKDTSLLRHHSALRRPTGMSGEGDHGNQPSQYNGVKKYRWDML